MPVEGLMAEIHALNSKIQIIAQRMKIIERNEEIIGKTLISHNKVLKELEATVTELKAGGGPALPEGVVEEFKKTKEVISSLKEKINENSARMDKIRAELNEVKYVLETFNPLQYATVDKVSDLVEEKIEEYLKKKKEG